MQGPLQRLCRHVIQDTVLPGFVLRLCSPPTYVPVHACRSLCCWGCKSMVACSIRASPCIWSADDCSITINHATRS
eukprot:jgi/Chrzof1/14623/Cz09g09250.t1